MIHFLVKREDERAQENQELKDMVKDLRDTHKQDVKTQTNLLKSIDRLTNQVADLTTQNKTLQQKVNDLLSQISVGRNEWCCYELKLTSRCCTCRGIRIS